MCQSLNLVVFYFKLKFVIIPPRLLFRFVIWDFPSIGDYSINILSVGKIWFIYLLYFVYTQAEQCSVGRIYS